MTPPRMAPGQRGGSPYPASQQHGYSLRGRGTGQGGGVAGLQGSPSVSISSAVQAVGVRRPGFGTASKPTVIRVNTCPMNIPDITVYHYDVAMEKALRAAFNLKLIEALQSQYPDVFIKAVAYDGKKNLYTSYKLNFGAQVSRQFDVTWTEENRTSNFKITMTEVREISMEVLRRYTAGQQSWDENVSTALTALNIVLRIEPSTKPTRSLSIPISVHHGHIVSNRAETHDDPQGTTSSVASAGSQTLEETLESHRGQYRPVHDTQAKRMYFM